MLSTGCLLSWGDETPRIWDIETGRCIARLEGHDHLAGAFELPDKRVLTWDWDCTLRTWDSATGEALTVFSFGKRRGTAAPMVRLRPSGLVITSEGLGSFAYGTLIVPN